MSFSYKCCVIIFCIELFLISTYNIMLTSANCCVYLPSTHISYGSVANLTLPKNCDTNVHIIDDTMAMATPIVLKLLKQNPNAVHLSFLDSKVSMEMGKVAREESIGYVNIDQRNCRVETGDDDVCEENYLKALIEISKLVYPTNAGIIASSYGCRNNFSRELHRNMKQSTTHNTILHYIDETARVESITKTIIDLKSKKATLLILLVDRPTMELIFEISANLGMNPFSRLWVTLEYGIFSEMNKNTPWYVMDLRKSNCSMTNQNAAVKGRTNQIKKGTGSVSSSMATVTCCLDYLLEKESDIDFNNSSLSDSITDRLKQRLKGIHCPKTISNIAIFTRHYKSIADASWDRTFCWVPGNKMIIESDAPHLLRNLDVPALFTKLKVVTIIDPPFTMLSHHYYDKNKKSKCDHGVVCNHYSNVSQQWNETCCIGMAIDLLLLIARDLNFEPITHVVSDGFYGSQNKKTGDWNGLVNDIILKKADLAVGAIMPTPDKLTYIDFSEPYMEAGLGILISTVQDTFAFINMEFLSPLENNLRYWIVGTFIVGTILVYLLENQRLALLRIIEPNTYPRYSWREGFTYFSGLTFQRDLGGKNPQRFGARVTAISFAFGMVIIMTTYTAVLTASKVSEEKHDHLFGFKDERMLKPSASYKFATVSHTGVESLFKHSEDEDFRRMYNFMLDYNVNTTEDGVERLQKGELKAFVYGHPFLQYYFSKQRECNLKIVGTSSKTNSYAFSMPKKSPWKTLISHSILKLKEREEINDLYNKWFPSSICGTEKANIQRGYVSVELKYFGGLIFLLAIFICITFCLLGLEHFCYRHHRRVINPLQDKIQVWRDGKAAGRRNAVIDPNDISEIKKLQKKKIQVRKKSKISKISKISMAAKTSKSASRSPSVSSVISEGEDELIRMRMRDNERGKKPDAATSGGNPLSLGIDLSHLQNAFASRSRSAPGPIVLHDTNDSTNDEELDSSRKSPGDDVASNSSANTQQSNAQQHCDIDLSSPGIMKETLKSSCKSLDSFSLRNVWKLLGEGEESNSTGTPITDYPNSETGFESGLDRMRGCCDSSMSQSNHSIMSRDHHDENNNNGHASRRSGFISDEMGSLHSMSSFGSNLAKPVHPHSDGFDESFFMDKFIDTFHQSEKLSVSHDEKPGRKISNKSVQADLPANQSAESLHKHMTCSNDSIRSIRSPSNTQQQRQQNIDQSQYIIQSRDHTFNNKQKKYFDKSFSIESADSQPMDQSERVTTSREDNHHKRRLKQFSSFEQCHTQSTSLDGSSDTGCATIHEERTKPFRAYSVPIPPAQTPAINNNGSGGAGVKNESSPELRKQTVLDLLIQ